jgi:ribonucleotide reductase alpha subunit
MLQAARECWDRALTNGEKYGYRNAQVTVIAPTGTIGLQMDCDTTGIEPDFAIVKFKKLAGGGYFKIVNASVKKALARLGYTPSQIKEIEIYATGKGTLAGCPYINAESLAARGFPKDKIEKIEAQLAKAFDIRFAFNRFVLGDDFLRGLGFSDAEVADSKFDLLSKLGFTKQQVGEANEYVCDFCVGKSKPPQEVVAKHEAVKCKADVKCLGKLRLYFLYLVLGEAACRQAFCVYVGAACERAFACRVNLYFLYLRGSVAKPRQRFFHRGVHNLEVAASSELFELDYGEVRLDARGVAVHLEADGAGWSDNRHLRVAVAVFLAIC